MTDRSPLTRPALALLRFVREHCRAADPCQEWPSRGEYRVILRRLEDDLACEHRFRERAADPRCRLLGGTLGLYGRPLPEILEILTRHLADHEAWAAATGQIDVRPTVHWRRAGEPYEAPVEVMH